ncbi:MAG TPA: DNA primase small subunit domain-containing protein [Candidatus Nanoarchaeia archaeon]|nr:hypothetical protein [uncultured archaeon]AQS34191.1 hypothetical protein [uncultured archaeon]HLC56569.1 DNA primase small subunit domain-containing protein [Candidatus Nanoarchaeia archaeon]
MDQITLLKYYSNKKVQEAILKAAKNREIAVNFGDKGFGKRPDTLQYENDILELAKQGATSFHISEETWKNPLHLKTGMSKKELDDLRLGWDLVIDIDGKSFELSRIAALLIVDALKFHDVKNISTKFSGNKGFHLGIPFKAFPDEVNSQKTKYLFPDGLRVIASYIRNMIKDPLSAKILELYSLEDLSKETGLKNEELLENKKFNPFSVVDIDTVLISSRHMFRAPLSLHEKSGLVSLPINPKDIAYFKREDAKIENVNFDSSFLDEDLVQQNEAKSLIIQAFDWELKKPKEEQDLNLKKMNFEVNLTTIPDQYFPPCIKLALLGTKTDGRKRVLFILLNFLRSCNYSYDQIKEILKDWNNKNYLPLKEGYINAQITWHKRQQKFLPPNCPHASTMKYYSDLNICYPDMLCKTIKNPVNYSSKKQRMNSKKNKIKEKKDK